MLFFYLFLRANYGGLSYGLIYESKLTGELHFLNFGFSLPRVARRSSNVMKCDVNVRLRYFSAILSRVVSARERRVSQFLIYGFAPVIGDLPLFRSNFIDIASLVFILLFHLSISSSVALVLCPKMSMLLRLPLLFAMDARTAIQVHAVNLVELG